MTFLFPFAAESASPFFYVVGAGIFFASLGGFLTGVANLEAATKKEAEAERAMDTLVDEVLQHMSDVKTLTLAVN